MGLLYYRLGEVDLSYREKGLLFLFDVVRVVVGFVCECAKSCELEENSETLLCKDRISPLPIMKLPAEYLTGWAKICRIDKFCHIRILAYATLIFLAV